jgi:tetratricopeptide (TPR) repeat protein/isopentenyldiphosphate isomerase
MTAGEFVGRQSELTAFRALLDPGNPCRLLTVNGFGGVGKSTLVEQFCANADERGHPVALVNSRRLAEPDPDGDAYPAAVRAMIAIERSVRRRRTRLPELTKKLSQYQQLHSSLTKKFKGEESAAVAAMLRLGLSAIGASVFPVAAPLVEVLAPELATQVAKAIASYRREADRRLLARPIEELTAALLTDVNERTAKRRVVLVFDEFELLPTPVEHWLCSIFHGEYGQLSARVLFVLSGRQAPGHDWMARGQAGGPSVVQQMHLSEFSDSEIVDYLVQRGPVDADAARAFARKLDHKYRLPLVLRLLAADPRWLATRIAHGGSLGPLAGELVGRLLDVDRISSEQRDLALVMSVARRFDLATIGAATPGIDPAAARDGLEWLRRQDFVDVRAPAYTYYELVRSVFLDHLRNTDHDAVAGVHEHLRHHFERQLEASGREEESLGAEVVYHALSAKAHPTLAEALGLVFRFLPTAYEYGLAWSRAITQVLVERPHLAEHGRLERLAWVLEQASRHSVPTEPPTGGVADPALDILFSGSFEDAAPDVDEANAGWWLSYLESRLRIVAGRGADLQRAQRDLLQIWQHLPARGDEPVLAFRVAIDLADIHTRRGELADAIEFDNAAVAIATERGARVWQAFALYQLGTNQKRQGAYGRALESLSAAIDLIPGGYYLGRFLLDRAVTLTYLHDTRAAEESFEAARAEFAGSSPISYAEASHRIGWSKRTRGDLDGALADHEAAIASYEELSAALGGPEGRASTVTFPLGKALHSMANVYADMDRHAEALRLYERAITMFREHGALRHEAIARKDRSWSRLVVDGPAAAEEDLAEAIRALGPGQSQRPAANAATHLAEAWLALACVRCCTGAPTGAREALGRALSVIGDEPNPPLLPRAQLQIALDHALAGAADRALPIASTVAERATADGQWAVAARAAVVEAVAHASVGDDAARDVALARARDLAMRWNQYEWRALAWFWTRLDETVRHRRRAEARPPDGPVAKASEDETIDVYDRDGTSQGHATKRLAHATGLWHRSFHCWIVAPDADGGHRILLQRRGPYATSFADFYDMSVAGHYMAGEDVAGGIRECREELGFEPAAEQLRLIAGRIIDEHLYNDTINREFQDIYVLQRSEPIDSYAFGYPELGAVIECPLDGLIGVVSGTVVSTAFRGRQFDAHGDGPVAFEGRLTQADLIAEARAYHRAVLPLVARSLDGGRGTPGVEVELADQSLWTELI